jgi:hypothetical protein
MNEKTFREITSANEINAVMFLNRKSEVKDFPEELRGLMVKEGMLSSNRNDHIIMSIKKGIERILNHYLGEENEWILPYFNLGKWIKEHEDFHVFELHRLGLYGLDKYYIIMEDRFR